MSIFNAMPIVAGAYGRKFGVRVVIDPNCQTAATDGKTIVIRPWDDKNPKERAAAWGLLTHEAGHCRYTDFGVRGASRIEEFLLNLVEDAWLEGKVIAELPGTIETLEAMTDQLVQAGGFAVTPGSDPVATMITWVAAYANGVIRGYRSVIPLVDAARAEAVAVFGERVTGVVAALLEHINQSESTSDNLQIVQALIKALEDEMERQRKEQEKQDQQGQPQQGQDQQGQPQQGQDQQGQPQQGQDQQGQPQQGQDQQGQPQQGQPQQGQDQQGQPQQGQDQQGQPQQGQDQQGQPQPGQGAAIAEAIKQVLNASATDSPKTKEELLRQMIQPTAVKAEQADWAIANPALKTQRSEGGCSVINAAKLRANALSQKLLAFVEELTDADRVTKSFGRKIRQSSVHRVSVGDPRIFVRKHETEAPTATVQVLIDTSGSMSMSDSDKGRIDMAKQAAASLALALARIEGVDVGVMGFGGKDITSVLPLGAEPMAHAGRFESLAASGGTPLREGLWAAAQQMASSEKARHVVFVVTDGAPASVEACIEMIRRMRESDIEVHGLGIQLGDNDKKRMNDLFGSKGWVGVNALNQLPAELFRLAQGAVERVLAA